MILFKRISAFNKFLGSCFIYGRIVTAIKKVQDGRPSLLFKEYKQFIQQKEKKEKNGNKKSVGLT